MGEPPLATASYGDEAARALIREGGRSAEVIALERSIVAFFIEAADILGVPKSLAAIYGVCFASEQPLGFSELNERLEISSGSISQGLRVLREIGALKVVEAPLEKRDRFVPDLELRSVVSHFMEKRLGRQLDAGTASLRQISEHAAAANGSSNVLRARLKSLETWHEKARAILPLVRTFLQGS